MADRGGRGDLIQQLRGNKSPSGHFKALLPTPLASDSEQAGGLKAYEAGIRGLSLTGWARMNSPDLLPTSQAQDFRNCADYSDGSRGKSPQLRPLGTGRLNPRFVEWMQGFPAGWTDMED